MAKRRGTEPPIPNLGQVSLEAGIQLLKKQIESGQTLLGKRPISSNEYESWSLLTKNCLERAFGQSSPNVSAVHDIGRFGFYTGGESESDFERSRAEDLEGKLSRLQALLELLLTEQQLNQGSSIQLSSEPTGHKVFLVHGSNDGVLHAVARFLEGLDQDVIILREIPNQGRTIIEKFEQHSSVGFAVVLLTPDDRGGPFTKRFEEQQPRARQNVVLEFGYFLGTLGRKRVCALYHEGVEIPSDYSGVLFVKLDDSGAWKLHLAKEMKAAGLPVDMNKAV